MISIIRLTKIKQIWKFVSMKIQWQLTVTSYIKEYVQKSIWKIKEQHVYPNQKEMVININCYKGFPLKKYFSLA